MSRSIWLVPALAAAMVTAAVVASRAAPPPAPALAPAPAPPISVAPHYAPPPPPRLAALPADCDDLLARLHRFERCSALAPESRAAVHQSITSMMDSLRSSAAASPEATAGECRQASDALAQAMTPMGC